MTALGVQARYLNMGVLGQVAQGDGASLSLGALVTLFSPVSSRAQDIWPWVLLPPWALVGRPGEGRLVEWGMWQLRYRVWMAMPSVATAVNQPLSGPASTLVSPSAFSAPASTGHSLRLQIKGPILSGCSIGWIQDRANHTGSSLPTLPWLSLRFWLSPGTGLGRVCGTQGEPWCTQSLSVFV